MKLETTFKIVMIPTLADIFVYGLYQRYRKSFCHGSALTKTRKER